MNPTFLVLETSALCQLHCPGCYRSAGRYTEGLMDPNLFESFIDRADPSATTIVPFWRGEPLLHPRLGRMLGYLRAKGFKHYLTTNGMVYDEDLFLSCLRSPLCYQIVFSIDGLGMDNALWRPGADAPRIEANLVRLIGLAKRYSAGCRIGLKLIRMGQDFDDLQTFLLTWLGDFGADFVIIGNRFDLSAKVPIGVRHSPCRYASSLYLVVDVKGWIHLCEHNPDAPRLLDGKIDAPVSALTEPVTAWDSLEQYPCRTCSMSYTGDPMEGTVRLMHSDLSVYFRQDYYNTIYSLEDIRRFA